MNVMITDISKDLNTDVQGVQTAITLFLLIMAILMIPCSKLTDRWGRKRCLNLGLALYGVGALLSAVAPNLGVLILGNSVFEGVGTALLIPPVYILATLWFSDLTSRAWAFGAISGLGGIGAAAGPLIGGLIATAIDWRAAFVFQAIVVATILLLSRRLVDPLPADPTRPFDAVGSDPVGGRHVLRGVRNPAGRHPQRALRPVRRARTRVPGRVLFLHPRPRAIREGAAPVDRPLQESHLQSALSSRRTCNGCCSWGRRSSCPSSSRPFADTARSERASSSPPRRSASSSRRSLRSGSPRSARSGR